MNSDMFPLHACGLFLAHNEYKDYYLPLETAIEEEKDWIEPSEQDMARVSGDIWTLQWYPKTPVGFVRGASANLDRLLIWAKRAEGQ